MNVSFLHPDQFEVIPIRRADGLYVDKTGRRGVAIGLNFVGDIS